MYFLSIYITVTTHISLSIYNYLFLYTSLLLIICFLLFAIKINKHTCFYFRLLRIKLKYLGHIIVKLANRFYLFLELIKLVKGNITHKTNKFLSSLNYNLHNHAENVNAKKNTILCNLFFFTLLYFTYYFYFFIFILILILFFI